MILIPSSLKEEVLSLIKADATGKRTMRIIILFFSLFSALEVSSDAHKDTVEKLVHECEICTGKSAMAGLFASLASAIILSLVINCLVYHRMRKISTCKIRDENVDDNAVDKAVDNAVEVISGNSDTEAKI